MNEWGQLVQVRYVRSDDDDVWEDPRLTYREREYRW